MVLGEVYRFVCVQDILNEFASKKCVKFAKLLEKGGIEIDKNKLHSSLSLNTNQKPENCCMVKISIFYTHLEAGEKVISCLWMLSECPNMICSIYVHCYLSGPGFSWHHQPKFLVNIIGHVS